MRTFHSYGPVDSAEHYSVERKEMVDQCTKQLVGSVEKGGHYFTIWGARQTGKTWLYRQSLDKIKRQFGDQFIVGEVSMQGIFLKKMMITIKYFLIIYLHFSRKNFQLSHLKYNHGQIGENCLAKIHQFLIVRLFWSLMSLISFPPILLMVLYPSSEKCI
ncbi:MAG: hypothetical protein OMM_13914 [Candidatus Magnetoglobus multicellularis str. Araruama]|uniref:Uncharacterized protein n=1 Tax=Candidatus Magnetoglobus multicellularis str. Araruama TaxID=890399 RepID=A0A1V1NT46_9BACT|nr:MAG: hypothetical protein OMM_13914 [Candidatus Magnetoglobus multicellularis str. Araruama]